ncbi:class I SAM-dependent methyltransferase [Synechocystis sp. PCC 7509]|uniref:class I SAM-dependent methyltransferase n=1 Tax=Synechocystis sp. PCC 7509 TaxID=927677 RepID=UPI0002AC9BC8|nr:class I SAM-dependent methyltransferase [Synechocystis sp. PCC 7509]
MATNSQQLAKTLSSSVFLSRGRSLWELNQQNWELPLTKIEKLLVGMYVILEDYSQGKFPPRFDDQKLAHDAEIAYRFSLPGLTEFDVADSEIRKPFWFGSATGKYLTDFINLVFVLEKLQISPPQKLLELGCGTGWMSEFLALMKFEVMATSISPHDIRDAQTRIKSLEAKNLKPNLEFIVSSMETVAESVQNQGLFDTVLVFEALHHAYDWRKAINSSYSCLKSGGWLLVCNEPNFFHTAVSYRIAKLSNTHEIGFKRSELIHHLKQTGFQDIQIMKNKMDWLVKPHWIAAQK